MTMRGHARQLREAARRHLDDALHVAERLHAVADEMDPPPRTAEPATDRDGNLLGMSLAELAAGQAIADFRAEDLDHIVTEPRYASESWRWIGTSDGHHMLVAGPGLMPSPRLILTCENIDAEDADGIAALPRLYRAIVEAVEWFEDDTFNELDELSDDCKNVLALLKRALAAARGEVPDA